MIPSLPLPHVKRAHRTSHSLVHQDTLGVSPRGVQLAGLIPGLSRDRGSEVLLHRKREGGKQPAWLKKEQEKYRQMGLTQTCRIPLHKKRRPCLMSHFPVRKERSQSLLQGRPSAQPWLPRASSMPSMYAMHALHAQEFKTWSIH